MRCRRHALSLLALGALFLVLAPAALADSAGDNQYTDPLGSTTAPSQQTTPASSPPPTQSSPSSSSGAPATTATTTTATATAATTTTTPSSTADPGTSQSSSATLPFTGLDLWPAVAIGIGLLGGGLALRRAVRPD